MTRIKHDFKKAGQGGGPGPGQVQPPAGIPAETPPLSPDALDSAAYTLAGQKVQDERAPCPGAPEQAERVDFSGAETLARDPEATSPEDPFKNPELLKVIDEMSLNQKVLSGPSRPRPDQVGEKINALFIAIVEAFTTHRISDGELLIFDQYIEALTAYFKAHPEKVVQDRRPNELDVCLKCKERVSLVRELKRVGFYGAGRIQ